MSADNWAVCPRCKDKRRATATTARHDASAAYGVQAIEEFDRLRAEAVRLEALVEDESDEYRTFREDYAIHGAAQGEVIVSYKGNCAKCGLSLVFEHRHPLEVDQDKAS